FYHVLRAFKDKRYIKVDGKPVFFIYNATDIAELKQFISIWHELAILNGLKGIHFIGQSRWDKDCKEIFENGFDAVCRIAIFDAAAKIKGRLINKILTIIRERIGVLPLNKFKYSDIISKLSVSDLDEKENIYPIVIPNFDHTPRSGRKALIYTGSTPDLFKKHLKQVFSLISHKPKEHQIVFLRSWNEWAEGNYVEPDTVNGHGYLDALKSEILG
ncbi:MAG TPA: glycoside hydrolase family 99-like domain-containing protein, partial [Prolixibacteraceae bacterium]